MENKPSEATTTIEIRSDDPDKVVTELAAQMRSSAAGTPGGDPTEAPSDHDADEPEARAETGEILAEPDPRITALHNLCTDVRSFFAAQDATALAIVADIKEPDNIPQSKPGDDAFNQTIGAYVTTLRELYSMRSALDEDHVFTQPAEDSEHFAHYREYSDRIYRAHGLRQMLAR